MARRIAARLIGDAVARLLTGPMAFLLAGVIDVLAFAARWLRARARGW